MLASTSQRHPRSPWACRTASAWGPPDGPSAALRPNVMRLAPVYLVTCAVTILSIACATVILSCSRTARPRPSSRLRPADVNWPCRQAIRGAPAWWSWPVSTKSPRTAWHPVVELVQLHAQAHGDGALVPVEHLLELGGHDRGGRVPLRLLVGSFFSGLNSAKLSTLR